VDEAGKPPEWAWVDVATLREGIGLPGVRMAGFRQHGAAPATSISMVAHPSVTLLIDLGEQDRLGYELVGRQEHGSVVIGLLPGRLRAICHGVGCVQIRLEPAVAAAVLGEAAGLTGAVVPLADIWGRDAERVEERLRRATSWDECFAIAAGAIRARVTRKVDPEVAYAWRQTRRSRGRLRVEDLADEVGWSRQRLWSRFRAQLGVTPKRAARLVRFDHAAHLLVAGHAPARVATESGYADQSHLHREVEAFAGLTPAGVAAAPWLSIDEVAWPGVGHERRPAAA
jgi:AraC-like DNA-binding protein